MGNPHNRLPRLSAADVSSAAILAVIVLMAVSVVIDPAPTKKSATATAKIPTISSRA
jgi:hypothetical protein